MEKGEVEPTIIGFLSYLELFVSSLLKIKLRYKEQQAAMTQP